MAKLQYTDRPAPAPAVVYCDASFLLDVFAAADPRRLRSHPDRARAQNAQGFLSWAQAQGVEFVTSILALEETTSALLFSEIRREIRTRSLRDWKALRAADNTTFQQLLGRGRAVMQVFHVFLRGLGISRVSTRRAFIPDDSHPVRKVDEYARTVIRLYELDAMDAYHIATARYCGIDWAATSDSDWQVVRTISVIAPR